MKLYKDTDQKNVEANILYSLEGNKSGDTEGIRVLFKVDPKKYLGEEPEALSDETIDEFVEQYGVKHNEMEYYFSSNTVIMADEYKYLMGRPSALLYDYGDSSYPYFVVAYVRPNQYANNEPMQQYHYYYPADFNSVELNVRPPR